jgi:RHS repeat-associated protein
VQDDVLTQNKQVDYADGFQYENNIIQFFPTAEGYASRLTTKIEQSGQLIKIPIEELPEDQFSYVYNYTDHLGNIRLSYSRDPDTQQLKIVEQNHYYPFGMRHTNYSGGRMVMVKDEELKRMAPATEEFLTYKYKFQGQERQNELGLNWDSFKWRNYDYAIGRFMNIDPLAEDYQYNSPYAFAENRVIDGRELEGLEWTSSTSSDGKTVTLNYNVKVINNTSGNLTNEQVSKLATERATALSCNFGGVDSDGRTVNVTVSQSNNATITWEYNTALHGDIVKWPNGTSEEDKENTLAWAKGITGEINNTQSNTTQVNVGTPEIFKYDSNGQVIFDDTNSRANSSNAGIHEDGHVGGLRHEDDKLNPNANQQAKDKKNLMNDGGPGNNISPQQRTTLIKNIEEQQPCR